MAASDLGKLAEAIIVTAEVMGHELPVRAAEAMARELLALPPRGVATALKRCQRELAGRLTLAAILQRVEDGHPGPEEAWALCQPARDENNTVVWTDEIAGAFFVAKALLDEGDQVAGRMAFLENYREALRRARAESKPVRFFVSPGHDKSGRYTAVLDAAERRLIPTSYAREFLGGNELAERRLRAIEGKRDDIALSPPDAQALAALIAKAAPKKVVS